MSFHVYMTIPQYINLLLFLFIAFLMARHFVLAKVNLDVHLNP